ncbi:MAG: hypothetical protein AB8B79_13030 [Granulosicoccus sp.]
MNTLRPIISILKSSGWSLIVWACLFAVAFQALQLLMLMLRFGAVPNYAVSYDWISNVAVIVNSTPSFSDIVPIVIEEWWIEIGYMNYDYGNGISEWSLNVMPSRLFILGFVGLMIGVFIRLRQQSACRGALNSAAMASVGFGGLFVGMTTVAMSWVVCCAAPSWVVGLAMLGLSVSASLALEDLGPTLFFLGITLLAFAIALLARNISIMNAEFDSTRRSFSFDNSETLHT